MADLVDGKFLCLAKLAVLESVFLKEEANVAGALKEILICGGGLAQHSDFSPIINMCNTSMSLTSAWHFTCDLVEKTDLEVDGGSKSSSKPPALPLSACTSSGVAKSLITRYPENTRKHIKYGILQQDNAANVYETIYKVVKHPTIPVELVDLFL